MLLTKRFEKVKLGLLVSILIFVVLLAGAYTQSYPFIQGSPSKGISVVYDNPNGFITVGDVLNVRWKDSDKDGKLDDWSLFIATSNGTELVKIDLLSSLVTPEGTYQLYEADTKTVSYFDVAENEYVLWKAKSQMPLEDEHYHRSFRLKFSFSKTSRWDVSLFLSLEEGKPYVLQEWEIIEKGDGAGSYILYPQFIVNFPLDRLILPANYTNNRLRYWHQRSGPRYANPWTMESDWPMFGAYVGNMHLNNKDIILHSSQNYDKIKTGVHASSAFAHYSNWVHDSTVSPPYFQYDFWVDWESNNAPSSDIEIEVWVPDVLDLGRTQILYSPNGVDWHDDSTWTLTEGNRGEPGFSSYGGCKHRLLITLPASIFTADDEVDSGTDYGDPRFGNDEYLLRLKIAYKDEGLATYEFEDSFSEWYGLKNIDDDWIWLINYKLASLSIGLVPTAHPKHLVVQVDHTERYRNLTLGFQKSLASNGSSSFYTNLIMFYASDAARQDTDNDGVYNMFDKDLPQFSPISALSVSRESLGKINYEMGRFDGTGNYSFWNFSKESLANEWNVSSLYAVSLSAGISQHLESDSAIFRFERDGYYVYDVSQSNEIRWKEETLGMQPTYQLCAMIGLIIVGLVLSVRCRELIKKHWVILALFMVGFGIRLCFLSLAMDFSGNDAALYGHVAKNVLDYGKFQANIIGLEPHWITSGLWIPPSSITHPYGDVTRWLYPSLMTGAFAVLGKSFFALKSVDLILGSLLVPLTYYLAKKLFDVKTAILATIIVVLHPLLIYYSGTHPGINIFPALLATAALCFMVYESKKAAVATGFCTGLLLLVRFEYAILLGGAILTYYIMSYKLKIIKQRNFYIIAFVFLIVFAFYFSYRPSLPFSTKALGGTMGEVRAPTLWETLSDPDFMQIRLYNMLYRYWYTLYEVSPLVFITAILGLLVNLKHWKKLSPLYLFPLYIIIAYSFVVREIPHQRYVVQLTPYLAILSAAFIVKLSLLRGRPSIGPKLQTKFRLKQTLLALVFIEIISLSFFSHYLVINVTMRNLAWSFDDGDLYRWIRTNTPKDSIIMTSSGVRFAYYVERQIVDMPHPRGKIGVDLDMIVFLIRSLNVDYLVINRLVYNIPDLEYIRKNPLNAPFGFTLVYWDEDLTAYDYRILIYDVRALHGVI